MHDGCVVAAAAAVEFVAADADRKEFDVFRPYLTMGVAAVVSTVTKVGVEVCTGVFVFGQIPFRLVAFVSDAVGERLQSVAAIGRLAANVLHRAANVLQGSTTEFAALPVPDAADDGDLPLAQHNRRLVVPDLDGSPESVAHRKIPYPDSYCSASCCALY